MIDFTAADLQASHAQKASRLIKSVENLMKKGNGKYKGNRNTYSRYSSATVLISVVAKLLLSLIYCWPNVSSQNNH